MPDPFIFSQRPEIEQNFLRRLSTFSARRRQQQDQDVGQARSEALARGLTGDPFESSLVSGARQAANQDISGYESGLGTEAAGIDTEDRRAAEARAYGTSERQAQEAFAAGEALKGREYGASEAEKARLFSAAEALKGREYGTSERIGSERFSGEQAALMRALQEKLAGQAQSFQGQQLGYDRDIAAANARKAGRQGLVGDILGAGGSILGGLALHGGGMALGAAAPLALGIGAAGALATKIFCFQAGTLVEMADGSHVPIENVHLGDETKGGRVMSTRQSISGNLFGYGGVFVTGSHAVLEDGQWLRIETSGMAIPVVGSNHLVFSLVTSGHRIFVKGIEFADEYETDHYETFDLDEALAYLNAEQRRKSCQSGTV